MKTQENILKEKLGLSPKDSLQLKRFNRPTRNVNYVLEVNGVPSYFLKVNSEGREKEKRMYDFLEKYPLFNTPPPLYRDDKLIVFPFISGFRDVELRNHLNFILNFHNKALKLPPEVFEGYRGTKLFRNHYVAKFVDRLNRHEDLVKNFWKDVEGLINFHKANPQEKFDSLPKILVHGDIQHKNLQEDSKGRVYLIDFEDVYFDSPSWDISRPLMDLETGETEEYTKRYVEGITISDKTLLVKAINRDFVIRVITDAIGRQQRFGIENAKPYLDIYRERYTEKLEGIVYGKN